MSGAPTWVALASLVTAVCFILALKGLSSPRSARRGNLIGAFGAALATVTVFLSGIELQRVGIIIGAVVVGSVVGALAARRVRMTPVPPLVALLNGVGGGAAGLVAITEWLHAPDMSGFTLLATALTILIGWASLTGSIVAVLKLQELMTTRPGVLPAGRYVTLGVALATLAVGAWLITAPSSVALYALVALSAAFGVLFVLPVARADVPIMISLLNAFTGLAVAASGFVLDNVLLMIAGTLVAASGTLLTRMMARAMGRPVATTLFGAFTATALTVGSGTADRPVRSCSPEDVAIMLGGARTVILVPGYGLAVAQAQHALRALADLLTDRGIEVVYAIHPVAGRMPGHMNVLLAEANVPFEQLRGIAEINPEFDSADVALVIGANDVVNPAARHDRSAPVYGMPILDVDRATQVVFLTRSMHPGFAGIDNELLVAPQTQVLLGDARDSLAGVVGAMARV